MDKRLEELQRKFDKLGDSLYEMKAMLDAFANGEDYHDSEIITNRKEQIKKEYAAFKD